MIGGIEQLASNIKIKQIFTLLFDVNYISSLILSLEIFVLLQKLCLFKLCYMFACATAGNGGTSFSSCSAAHDPPIVIKGQYPLASSTFISFPF